MKVYEVVSYGIPECHGISYGLFLKREDALKKLEEQELRLKEIDEGYGADYSLRIVERDLE